jgi:hypothetical protein
MGKSLRASVLVLLLACSAQAGYIQNDRSGTPPTPPPSAEQEEPTTDDTGEPGEPDSFTETLLSVLESVLALL